jgi:glycosyltransferase involved in cell wall biosynthesis
MKVLILYNKIWHYRVPIFNIVSKKVDLTVAFSEGKKDGIYNFKTLFLDKWSIGRFVVHKINLFTLCKNYDRVIVYGNISWVSYVFLAFNKKRNYKLAFWSPGVSASYTKKFDSNKKWNSIRDFFYRRADGLIFYSTYPFKQYVERGFDKNKLFVAENTVEVNPDLNSSYFPKRKNILFIGTLYKAKGIFLLLESYKKAFKKNSNIPILEIIGDGPYFNELKNQIKLNKLEKQIITHGSIYDEGRKEDIFKRALAVISPNQSGLGVLESFAHGVCFITYKDSITGGERLNISNNYNGLLLSENQELSSIILNIYKNQNKYLKMGQNAKKYYQENRTSEIMANGLLDFIIN